jgi:cell division septum initiation protein DivIVA
MSETASVPITDAGARRILGTPEFRVSGGGYDPSDVAAFLDRFGAKAMELMGRLRDAEAAAEAARLEAEDLRAGSATPESSKDLFQRTLALAEQTATASIADARQRADRVVEEAEQNAARMTTETRLRVERMLDDARNRARELHDEERSEMAAERGQIQDEAAQLETLRLATAAETMALEEARNELRRRLRGIASDLLAVSEHPEALGRQIAPGVSEVAAAGSAEMRVPSPAEAIAPGMATGETTDPPAEVVSTPISARAEPSPVGEMELASAEAVGADEPDLADGAAAEDEEGGSPPAGEGDPDAFDRFMSEEIEEEPSRDWIMA